MDQKKFKEVMKDLSRMYYDYCTEIAAVFVEKIDNATIKTVRQLREELSAALQGDDCLHNEDMVRFVYFISRARESYTRYHKINECDDQNKAWHAFRADVEGRLFCLLDAQRATMEEPWTCRRCWRRYDAHDKAIQCAHPKPEEE